MQANPHQLSSRPPGQAGAPGSPLCAPVSRSPPPSRFLPPPQPRGGAAPLPPAHLRVRLLRPLHPAPAPLLQVLHSHALEAGRDVGPHLAVALCAQASSRAGGQALAGAARRRLAWRSQHAGRSTATQECAAWRALRAAPRPEWQPAGTGSATTPPANTRLTRGLWRLLLNSQPHCGLEACRGPQRRRRQRAA